MEEKLWPILLSTLLEENCMQIEEALVEADTFMLESEAHLKSTRKQLGDRLQLLNHERRALPSQSSAERVEISKNTKREMERATRREKRKHIMQIHKEFKGGKHMQAITRRREKRVIAVLRDSKGLVQSERQRIADVFADELYNCKMQADVADKHREPITPFSKKAIT